MKHVACYCRVSTDEQVKFGFSIQAQKDALEKYCKEKGYKYDFFVDEGISASSMKKRKALNEMLDKSNAFDAILFTKLDRLSRNVLDANNINKILQENNCTMKAIDEDDIDTSTADGTFMFNLRVSLAQREIGKTSERIKFVFENKRNNGEVTSGTKKYGYDIVDKKYQINPIEAENIVNLYKYFISVNGNKSKTYEYFIEHFEGKGQDALYYYLRETAYIGKYKLHRKQVYIDNYIPRIMPDELFNQVQNLLVKRQYSTKKPSATALFAGLLYCNCCGLRMTTNFDHRVKCLTIRYRCDYPSMYIPGTTKRKCSNRPSVREDFVEEYLLSNLHLEFEKYKSKINIENLVVEKKSNTELIKKIEKKINKLKDLYLDDLIDKPTYEKDYKKYSKELSELKNDAVIGEKKKDLTSISKIINSDYKIIYDKLNRDNKRRFWLSIIDKIYIDEAKIKEVTFL